jgi:hypothetical protein
MFTAKDYRVLVLSLVFLVAGFGCMLYDPVAYGFGPLTRWVAPPLLLIGFILPVFAILGAGFTIPVSWSSLRKETWKHLPGFMVFVIALTTYLLTLEPTASIWDCSEFIATVYKLQVPHTPGTPLLLLVGRLFSMAAGNDVSRVAVCVNAMSALFSAGTIYIVYYLIFYFGTAMATSWQISRVAIVMAAVGGSLCLAFSDSFWFSAVEAETYGPACFFQVLLLWLMLRSDGLPDGLRDRRFVLIFYVAGLGYCIHPMSVLVLPVLPLVWYTQKRKLTLWNVAGTVVAGMALVMVVNRVVAIGIFEFAFAWDLFLVNVFHLPFYTGVFLLLSFITVLVVWSVRRYARTRPYTWAMVFLLLGFAPYFMLFVRSGHNPPIDEGNPENLPLSKAYMNRESYPTSPLLTGPYFDAQVTEVTPGRKMYYKTPTGYGVAGTLSDYRYDPARTTFLPRMYSNDPDHIKNYQRLAGLKEGVVPRFSDNIRFMFSYQLGYMYFRYFLWNFAGRESDVQGSEWLRPWDALQVAAKPQYENRARNQYWAIPLVLGVVGLVVQARADRKGFAVNFFFYLLTGVILVLYLNSPPSEPRERDYIYVGSYMAFALWTGLGMLALARIVPAKRVAVVIVSILALAVPAWMAWQNWNDHDRSGRTFQMANARNVLDSCAPGAILFTGGDNDTFPLWYLQDVEGFRTDVRVVVLSYFNTDWYVNQLRRAYYDSPPFALTLTEKDYLQYGINDVLYVRPSVKGAIDLEKYLQLLHHEHPALRVQSAGGDAYNIMPSSFIRLRVDTAGMIHRAGYKPLPEVIFKAKGSYLTKNTLAFLDVVASNHWKRPVYFNFTSLHSLDLELEGHVIQEGQVYRLAPIEHTGEEPAVDTQLAYRNLIERADYSNLADAGVYFNTEDYQARMIAPVRMSVNSLAVTLLRKGDREQASEVLQAALDKLYPAHLDPGYAGLQAADLLQAVGKADAARALCARLFDFQYDRVQVSLREHRDVDQLERYLAYQSAELLSQLGEEGYKVRLAALGVL